MLVVLLDSRHESLHRRRLVTGYAIDDLRRDNRLTAGDTVHLRRWVLACLVTTYAGAAMVEIARLLSVVVYDRWLDHLATLALVRVLYISRRVDDQLVDRSWVLCPALRVRD